MAYVEPRERQQDVLAAVVRNTARALAVAAYATAVAVAVMILAPVVLHDSAASADITPGPAALTYTAERGDTPAGIAAGHGIAPAELYALNPRLTPLHVRGLQLVVGLR
jgi:LysM repeat protein